MAHFAADLAASVAFGDARYAELRELIAVSCARRGRRPPEMPPAPRFTTGPSEPVHLSDLGAVVFTSGYRPGFRDWVAFPQAFDDLGFPIQKDGSSTVIGGLHFIGRGSAMPAKAVISLTTGLEDPEKVTVAFLVAVGGAESGRPTLMFLAKEAVRLAVTGVAKGVACAGCPPILELFERYEQAGGTYLVCPICVDAKQIDKGDLLPNAEIGGTVAMWQWIGDDGATTFSY